jgi:hypothetical protein
VGAYTDSLISLQPFYSFWRIMGAPSGIAYQLCAIGLLAACFLAMWWLLRRGFRATPLPAAAGAFLFAFSSPRVHQLGHIQLFAHFALPLALLGLVLELREGRKNRRQWRWIALFAGAMVVELYGSIYMAWFSLMLLGVAASTTIFWPRGRKTVSESLCRKPLIWLVTMTTGGLACLPVFLPYLRAARTVPHRPFTDVLPLLPPPTALLYPGPSNWIAQLLGIGEWSVFSSITAPLSQTMSPGITASLMVMAGCWLSRRDRSVVLPCAVGLVCLLLVMRWPGDVTLWRWFYDSVPGAPAFRAMGRIVLPLLAPAGIALAVSVERVRVRCGTLAAVGLVLLMVVEQGQFQTAYDWREFESRSRSIASAVPSYCDAFVYSPADKETARASDLHYDAMWAALFADMPTVNGHSGVSPPGWYTAVKWSMNPDPSPVTRRRLLQGLREAGAGDMTVCWARLSLRDHEVTSSEVIDLHPGR